MENIDGYHLVDTNWLGTTVVNGISWWRKSDKELLWKI